MNLLQLLIGTQGDKRRLKQLYIWFRIVTLSILPEQRINIFANMGISSITDKETYRFGDSQSVAIVLY
jgi:hypothetical protein